MDVAQEVQELQAKYDALQAANNDLQSKSDALDSANTALQAKYDKSIAAVSALQAKYDALEQLLVAEQQKNDALQAAHGSVVLDGNDKYNKLLAVFESIVSKFDPEQRNIYTKQAGV